MSHHATTTRVRNCDEEFIVKSVVIEPQNTLNEHEHVDVDVSGNSFGRTNDSVNARGTPLTEHADSHLPQNGLQEGRTEVSEERKLSSGNADSYVDAAAVTSEHRQAAPVSPAPAPAPAVVEHSNGTGMGMVIPPTFEEFLSSHPELLARARAATGFDSHAQDGPESHNSARESDDTPEQSTTENTRVNNAVTRSDEPSSLPRSPPSISSAKFGAHVHPETTRSDSELVSPSAKTRSLGPRDHTRSQSTSNLSVSRYNEHTHSTRSSLNMMSSRASSVSDADAGSSSSNSLHDDMRSACASTREFLMNSLSDVYSDSCDDAQSDSGSDDESASNKSLEYEPSSHQVSHQKSRRSSSSTVTRRICQTNKSALRSLDKCNGTPVHQHTQNFTAAGHGSAGHTQNALLRRLNESADMRSLGRQVGVCPQRKQNAEQTNAGFPQGTRHANVRYAQNNANRFSLSHGTTQNVEQARGVPNTGYSGVSRSDDADPVSVPTLTLDDAFDSTSHELRQIKSDFTHSQSQSSIHESSAYGTSSDCFADASGSSGGGGDCSYFSEREEQHAHWKSKSGVGEKVRSVDGVTSVLQNTFMFVFCIAFVL